MVRIETVTCFIGWGFGFLMGIVAIWLADIFGWSTIALFAIGLIYIIIGIAIIPPMVGRQG